MKQAALRLTDRQVSVLNLLAHEASVYGAGSAMYPAQVARRIHGDVNSGLAASASRTLHSLEALGLVERRPQGDDFYRLTDDGVRTRVATPKRGTIERVHHSETQEWQREAECRFCGNRIETGWGYWTHSGDVTGRPECPGA